MLISMFNTLITSCILFLASPSGLGISLCRLALPGASNARTEVHTCVPCIAVCYRCNLLRLDFRQPVGNALIFTAIKFPCSYYLVCTFPVEYNVFWIVPNFFLLGFPLLS
jgi:hypothetical protein